VALYRLLDVLPVFEGDARVTRLFTLVPGSDFGTDALAAVSAAGGRTVPWAEACERSFDLILTASPKGALQLLRGDRVLLPHGAGFGKTIPSEGSADAASGLDPAYLLPQGDRLVLHALAHPDQVAQLRAASPRAAARATVVGDPTLDRLLASRPLRESYRRSMGTGSRQLVVLASTWGPESLLRQRPDLPAELAACLPFDTHQLAMIVHPNERSALGEFDLAERLAPALTAGMMLPAGFEEWAAVLVAADVLVTDHGSAALYFAALGDRPIVSVYDGRCEVIPRSPVDGLLKAVPRLQQAADLRAVTEGYGARTGRAETAVRQAFAEQGRALTRLRRELYALLGLTTPVVAVWPRTLPAPAPPPRLPAAFDVHVHAEDRGVRVERIAAGLGPAGHHLAVEYGAVGEHFVRTAGLLYRRATAPPPGPHHEGWTAADWSAFALDEYAGCTTAAVVLPDGACVLRRRGDTTVRTMRVAPATHGGKIVQTDPAAALSAVHAAPTVSDQPLESGTFTCLIGHHTFEVTLTPAEQDEASRWV
jgi:hypothetical protein